MSKNNKNASVKMQENMIILERLVYETADAVESPFSKELAQAKRINDFLWLSSPATIFLDAFSTKLRMYKNFSEKDDSPKQENPELVKKIIKRVMVSSLTDSLSFEILRPFLYLIGGGKHLKAKFHEYIDNKVYSNSSQQLILLYKETTIKKMVIVEKQKEMIESLIERNKQIKNETQEMEEKIKKINHTLKTLEIQSS